MNLEVLEQVSPVDETCRRCLSLGLPPGGIPAGTPFFAFVKNGGEHAANCCPDCWQRLTEETDHL